MESTNRYLQLTASGAGAIAVLRLVGPGVERFLARWFSRGVAPGCCVHGLLRDGERVIDDVIVVRVEPGVVDINLHGGAWVMRSAMALAEREGFARVGHSEGPLAEGAVDGPGEISREILQYLPMARTELAVRALLAQAAAWEKLQGAVLVEPMELKRLRDDRSLVNLLSLSRVAIVGPANVGKSTLANQLFGQERSITADVPGTTRDWVGEMANIDGLAVMLVDTPGRRATEDPIESSAIIASVEQVAGADLVVLVLDRSLPIEEQEKLLMREFPDAIRVANKADRRAAWDEKEIGAIATVASTSSGVGELRAAILRHFGCWELNIDLSRCWTSRQVDWVQTKLRKIAVPTGSGTAGD